MTSIYKYISTDKQGNELIRVDLILLEGLALCDDIVPTRMLIEISDPRNQAHITEEMALKALAELVGDGFVAREVFSGKWAITPRGRAHLVKLDTQSIFNSREARAIFEACDRTTKRPRIEEAPEPVAAGVKDMDLNARLRASHAKLDKDGIPAAAPASTLGEPRMQVTICDTQEPKLPAVATVCIGEDELDAWWDSLDVDQKADAFAGFALRMYQGESRIAVEPASIPILGTVGETAEEWAAIVDRVNGKQPAAAGGAK